MAEAPEQTPGTAHDPVGETTLRQRRAATPGLSAWVAANAGSGKTHVLADRVVRLLLDGARPSSILCLTYTKAAAAEMSNRVFRMLAEWARLPGETLAAEIARITGDPPARHDLERARQLFALALETPGGLKIQTIHAFCEAVLHRFPLEANIAGRFQVLDDASAGNLLAEARRNLFHAGGAEEASELHAAVEAVLDLAGEAGLDGLLAETYGKRRQIAAFIDRAQRAGGLEAALRVALGLGPQETREEALAGFWPLEALPVELLRQMEAAASGPKPAKIALEFAREVLGCGSAPDAAARASILCGAFLTGKGERRKFARHASTAVKDAVPDIGERLEAACGQVMVALDRQRSFDALEANLAALAVVRRYVAEFDRLKHRQALLDFDDMIAATDALLSRSGAGAWVHYKLDQGVDHILVDEAQDTAPLQWNVIRALSAEFFAGSGSRGGIRTLFSVGDQKQSIYSFQGARPEQFALERRLIEKRARNAGLAFEHIPLRVSFRSTREVLKLVDWVYADHDARRGMGEECAAIVHESARPDAPGLAEIWDMIAAEKIDDTESWTEPFDHVPESSPPARLAARISETLQAWIGTEMIMEGKGRKKVLRPVRPGDILVLVRKRDGFVPTLLRTLKTAGNIPVAGADRLKLTDHIAVQDLVALGRHVLLPADDLSLAGLVKSPLADLDEDDLYRLAAERPEGASLAAHLETLARSEARFAAFRDLCRHWRALAQRLSVHDFYATMLGPNGGRERYLARLGTEVSDVLDEFLGLALDHDQAGIPGLQSFVAALDSDAPEIKREMEQGTDAVRVMTVHAAKGLEAPIVFLVDSGGAAHQHAHAPKLWLAGEEERPVPLWLPSAELRGISAAAEAVALYERQAEEEYRRLLYVGLTRPADRLIVCGYRGLQKSGTPMWHDMVSLAFDRAKDDAELEIGSERRRIGEDGFEVRRLTCRRHSAAGEPAAVEKADHPEPAPAFTCPGTPLPKPLRLPRPFVPSAAGAALSDDGQEAAHVSPFAARQAQPHRGAAERGRAAHRLLQVLPALGSGERAAAARRYAARALPDLDAAGQAQLVAEVLAILDHAEFSPVFGGDSATEVSLMGRIGIGGAERVVSGRIDRMAVFDDHVLIVDYKTGATRPGPAHHPEHAAQLAVYRELLKPLYPGRDIRAALLYTAEPRLVYLAAAEMDLLIARLAQRTP